MVKRITAILFLEAALLLGAYIADESATVPTEEQDLIVEVHQSPFVFVTDSGTEESIPEIEESEEQEDMSFYYESIPFDIDTQRAMHEICEAYGVEYQLIMAMAKTESDFKADCIGDHGDSEGLGQIQRKWHQKMLDENGITDLFDPLQNVKAMCILMSDYINQYGTIDRALAKYNTGKPKDECAYRDKVFNNYWILEETKNE